MRNGREIAAGGLFLCLLSGCASTPRKPFVAAPPPPDSAAVYFYRPSEMTARLQRPAITANGAKLGRLGNHTYGVAYLSPGDVQLRSTWLGIPGSIRDDAVTVRLEAGKNYYMRVRYHVGKPRKLLPGAPVVGVLAFEDRTGLEEVPESEAVPQLAGMDPCDTFPPIRLAPSPSSSQSGK